MNNDAPATGLANLSGAFWCHFPRALQYGKGAILAHLLWRRLTGGDFIKVMNDYPYAEPVAITQASDLRKIRPAPIDAPFYRDQLQIVRGIVDRTQGRFPVFATVINPFGHLRGRLGTARMSAFLAEDPRAVGAALSTMAESLAGFARACISEAGADGIFFASQGGEAERLDDAGFQLAIGQPDRLILAAAGQVPSRNILHICGHCVALHRYQGFQAAAVNWDAEHNDTPAEGLWPGAVRLPGLNLEGALLHGDASAIRTEVRALQRTAGQQPFPLTAACTVPGQLPFWRMRTALAAARGQDSRHGNPLDLAAWHALRQLAAFRRRLG